MIRALSIASALMFAAALMLLSACSTGQTQTVNAVVTWTNPATYTDGSAFVPAANMKGALISWGTVKGGAKPNQVVVTGAVTTATVPYPGTEGTYYFDVVIQDKSGTQSAPSAEVAKIIPFPPSPATNVQVN
jgi:hypothetical protein